MARIREVQGDLDGALDLLDQAERLYEGNFSPNVRPIRTRKVRVWLTQGRISDALEWVHEQRLSVDNELSYLREFDHMTLARVLLARYQNDQCRRFHFRGIGIVGAAAASCGRTRGDGKRD